jgi:Uncharacterized protein conserved in bacteria
MKTKEYILFFRMDITTPEAQPTAEQMAVYMEQWSQWIEGIVAQDKMVSGNHLSPDGFVLKTNGSITNGPHIAEKQSIAGYIIVEAKAMEEALAVAKDCPILQGEGTSVEVRQISNT